MGRGIGIFEVLGNRNRRRIIELIAERPRYMSELSEELGVGQKAVIDHLRVLRDVDLVTESPGRYNRKYFRLSRSIHAELFISPNAARTVVRELPKREGSRRDASVEEILEELRELEELRREVNRLSVKIFRRMDRLVQSISEEDVKDEVLKRMFREERL